MARDTLLGFPAHTLHPQGVCGIRKAAKPLTAAQAPRTAANNLDPFFAAVTVAALRFPRPFGRTNRATSSKPARFIRHWRRFADFHVRQKKRLSARKRAHLRRVRCRGLQSPSKKQLCSFF